jgi:polyphosphate kinase
MAAAVARPREEAGRSLRLSERPAACCVAAVVASLHHDDGVVDQKTHAKLCLLVRAEQDGLRRYAHSGTGNYKLDTPRSDEDIGPLTADPDVTDDVAAVFDLLTGCSRQTEFRRLLVAPSCMRRDLLEPIRAQASPEGRITPKLNSLANPQIIDAARRRLARGRDLDVIVRGCCLRPGVAGPCR